MHQRFKLILFAALAFGCGIGLGLLPPVAYQAQPPKKAAQKPAPKVGEHPQHTKSTGYVPLTPERRAAIAAIDRGKHGQHIKQAAKNLVLPAAYDVRVKSPLPIGDQGPCGSCYLYSTVRTMTDAGVMMGYGKPNGSFALSVQYGMDSPRNFGGCDGGNGTEVIQWAVQHGWIAEKWVDAAGVAHTDYPAYEARSGRDRTAPGAKVWAQGWTWGLVSNSGRASTADVKAAMFLYGRLNVALDAGGQFGNGTNTITQLGSQINHEINMVAWDDNKDGGAFLLENQWGCYNEDMEILTDHGWIHFKDLRGDETVATLNPRTHDLEYQRIEARQVYDFNGEMYHYKAQGVDLMVTPNHKMYVGKATNVSVVERKEQARTGTPDVDDWRLEEAQNLAGRFRMKKDANWMAPDVPSYRVGDVEIPMDLWLEFLGYFVSEGHSSLRVHERLERQRTRTKLNGSSYATIDAARTQTDYVVGISQNTGEKADVMQKCLDRMPFKFSRSDRSWATNNKALFEELSPLGKSTEKYLPAYVRTISQRQSKILLDALMLGDGTRAFGNYVYFTSSKQLADDVQELALRAGLAADVSFIDRIGRVNSGGTTRNLEYRVSIKTTRVEPCPKDAWSPEKVPYCGKVYCVTVPNHVIYVRRNGQATWCGNSNWGTNGCRWVTYSAAQNIVDQFWVSAGTIPPPPPPPVPPDPGPGPVPTPGSVVSVVVTMADGSTQTLTTQRNAVSINYSDGTSQPIVQPKKP